ncbi:CU044_5270 family protein [Actinosynnema sp. NPDC047251]|uniref:Uncharacterized protein n=1 Tax=Saccharothrix espanaensis (strain ATCC 51144 / DSM 44229 / JCM 9112 / NBRC 15066 / NRRL 15764) TaxID=1179773 RepID=K0KEY8_SACES|nr:CU044_5270 family protein [Saccharothrix espanaensis]CCH35344.1 hypothetical protein BN6_81270 [Saccharothrix espanaensis DSM 44229]
MRENSLDLLLDRALDRAVADEPGLTGEQLDQGRLRLAADLRRTSDQAPTGKAPAGRTTSWKPRRVLAAAAALAVLTATGLVWQGVVDTSATAAAASLNRAADLAASVVDQPVGPGQYRYVRSRYVGVTVALGDDTATTAGLVNELWIPSDPKQEWLERQADDGPATWFPGKEGQGTPPGNPASRNGEFRAPCGDFSYMAEGTPDRCTRIDWSNPSPEFLAGLPTDPKALHERLVRDGRDFVPAEWGTDAGVLRAVQAALASGRVPAAVRAQLYRALAHVPGLQVTDDRANLDGKVGTALGVRVGDEFVEVVIDPANGEFIGRRDVTAVDAELPEGTVRQSSSTTIGVADALGVAPR